MSLMSLMSLTVIIPVMSLMSLIVVMPIMSLIVIISLILIILIISLISVMSFDFDEDVIRIFFFLSSCSSDAHPGVCDGDILLGCDWDTPALNIEAVAHAECSVR